MVYFQPNLERTGELLGSLILRILLRAARLESGGYGGRGPSRGCVVALIWIDCPVREAVVVAAFGYLSR
jgi:hypothetical protein